MNIYIGETMSSPTRVRQVASIRRHVRFLVNGTVEELDFDAVNCEPTILVLGQRQWKNLWTLWQHDYRVPPVTVAESVWSTVRRILDESEDVKKVFGGAFARGFVWGMIPDAEGVVARERFTVGGGGLFLEHYMLCRAGGFQPDKAMEVTLDMAVRGGTTPIPRQAA